MVMTSDVLRACLSGLTCGLSVELWMEQRLNAGESAKRSYARPPNIGTAREAFLPWRTADDLMAHAMKVGLGTAIINCKRPVEDGQLQARASR